MKLLILTQKVDSADGNLGFFHAWIEEFARQCESVVVICLYEGPYDLPNNVRVLSLGKESGASRLKYIGRFYRYIWNERKNYDAVFVHMNEIYVILGGFLWRLLGKRIGLWYAHGKTGLILWKATLLTHDVFTSTPGGFRIRTRKLHIIGQGIDTKTFTPSSVRSSHMPGTLELVTAGRMSPVKGYEHMVEAVSILRAAYPQVRLKIIGGPLTTSDRGYEERLRVLVAQKGLSSNVSLLGPLPHKDIVPHLQSADMFLNMGQTGSLDKAILDAMACGIPVVSGNDAYRHSLTAHQELLTCKPDDARDLAAKIDALSHLPEETLRVVREYCRMFVVERHGLPAFIRRILAALTRA